MSKLMKALALFGKASQTLLEIQLDSTPLTVCSISPMQTELEPMSKGSWKMTSAVTTLKLNNRSTLYHWEWSE